MKSISKIGLIVVAFITIISTSCKNELDVNGNLTSKIAVYGLLSYGDSAHYLKIYKTFLTEDNIYIAAQNPDNYLLYDSIDVFLIETYNGSYRILQFVTTTEIPKDSGIFTNPQNPTKQVLYVNRDVLNPLASYELQIKNKYTGKLMAGSSTGIVFPNSYGTPEYSTNPLRITQGTDLNFTANNGSLKINLGVSNAYRFEAYYHFYYWEKTSVTATDSVLLGPITINVGRISLKNDSTSFSLNWSPYSSFFNTLNQKIPQLDVNNTTIRRTGPVHLFVWAAGLDYSNYIANNSTSYSIVEERPTVTNINNGIGLFSTRYCVQYTNYRIGSQTKDILINNPAYSKLHFLN
jgi:hypothetical protein